MKPLTPNEISAALANISQWRQQNSAIARRYEFQDFVAAIAFVNRVAEAADTAWHHPDIDIRWNKVTLTLTTHDAGGLTGKDFSLAAVFDTLANSPPPMPAGR